MGRNIATFFFGWALSNISVFKETLLQYFNISLLFLTDYSSLDHTNFLWSLWDKNDH